MEYFADWVKTEVIDEYGLDGLDLDDENGGYNPQGFLDIVGVLRYYLADKLITKPLYQDLDYFTSYQVSSSFPAPFLLPIPNPNAGKYLGEMLDIGSTMAYWDTDPNQVDSYHNVTSPDGRNVGLSYNRLCIGVQAGPPPSCPSCSGVTPIDEVYQLAQWCVAPASSTKPIPPILGMMLFTFSQDIQQFTCWPQNSALKMFPNGDDHQWQRTIVAGFLGEPQPSGPPDCKECPG